MRLAACIAMSLLFVTVSTTKFSTASGDFIDTQSEFEEDFCLHMYIYLKIYCRSFGNNDCHSCATSVVVVGMLSTASVYLSSVDTTFVLFDNFLYTQSMAITSPLFFLCMSSTKLIKICSPHPYVNLTF